MTDFTITHDFPKSEIEFDSRFSNPEECYLYLFKQKWPNGFECTQCRHQKYWHSSRNLYICKKCEHQHSLTSGTIMEGTKKPITYWFKAMWWFTTRKSGVNAVNLKELLGLGSYGTAWTWLQKLRRCTIRHDREKLSGRVEVDEFFIGGQRSGKRGRGADGKIIVAVAVERDDVEKQIGRIRLHVTLDSSGYSLETFILDNIKDGSTIATDQWRGYTIIDKEQYNREITNQSKTKDYNKLYGVHLVTTLVKRLMRSTFQGRFEPKYLQNYLDEYVFRFNRRNSSNVGMKFMRIVQQAIKTAPIKWDKIQWDMDPISEHFLPTGAF